MILFERNIITPAIDEVYNVYECISNNGFGEREYLGWIWADELQVTIEFYLDRHETVGVKG